MQNFQDIVVWRKAHAQVPRLYTLTKDFPQSENFGLVLNLRRTATFIPARIAEGSGKATDAEFAIELKRARATGYELEYLLLVSRDLGLLPELVHDEMAADLVEVRKMISAFIKRLTVSL